MVWLFILFIFIIAFGKTVVYNESIESVGGIVLAYLIALGISIFFTPFFVIWSLDWLIGWNEIPYWTMLGLVQLYKAISYKYSKDD